MSLKTLNQDLETEFEHLMERITEHVDQLGLDETCQDVKDLIDYWFGASIVEGYEDWIAK